MFRYKRAAWPLAALSSRGTRGYYTINKTAEYKRLGGFEKLNEETNYGQTIVVPAAIHVPVSPFEVPVLSTHQLFVFKLLRGT